MDTRMRCTIMRGGTSKGVVVSRSEVEQRLSAGWDLDPLLVALMGSSDPSQVDGLGSASSTTSKVMIVDEEPDVDGRIGYHFAQVGVAAPVVDHGGNCGNFTAAVAAYVVDRGLVPTSEPVTSVPLRNLNTGVAIDALVPTLGGAVQPEGEYVIDGVAGSGGRILTRYLSPGGSVTSSTLPTGRPIDVLVTSAGESVEVSLVDVTNPVAFVRASDLGITGTERPQDLDDDAGFLARAERVRAAAAVRLGLAPTPHAATATSPGLPKLSIIAAPAASPEAGRQAPRTVVARMMSMQRTHPTYALTGAMCTAAASLLVGTIPAEGRPPADGADVEVRIIHARGEISVDVETGSRDDGELEIASVSVFRTARLLFEGHAPVRQSPTDVPSAA